MERSTRHSPFARTAIVAEMVLRLVALAGIPAMGLVALAGIPMTLRAQSPPPSAIAPMPILSPFGAPSFASNAAVEVFAIAMTSTVQLTPLVIRDSTAGASQTYAGNVILAPAWDLRPTRFVTLYAYVSQPLTNGVATIPASAIEASAQGGTGTGTGAWSAFSATVDGHPYANTLTIVDVSGKTKTSGDENITIQLRLNTTNLAIPAGVYTGIVTFGARVQ